MEERGEVNDTMEKIHEYWYISFDDEFIHTHALLFMGVTCDDDVTELMKVGRLPSEDSLRGLLMLDKIYEIIRIWVFKVGNNFLLIANRYGHTPFD